MDRVDPLDRESWSLTQDKTLSLEGRCVAALRSQGIPATAVKLDPAKLKGGYST